MAKAKGKKASPTPDVGSVGLSPQVPEPMPGMKSVEELKTVQILEGYRIEADEARKAGLNPRDQKWEENLALYWNRFDFSKKASWQAQEIMPEVPSYVDRFAAALKEALVASDSGFFSVKDPADKANDLATAIKNITTTWLSRSGRNQMGTILSFPAVFEEQMKLGALMACASATTWKRDVDKGRVAIETVDPRFIWLDPTYRNLYRVRRIEMDLHDLKAMALEKDAKGQPIYHLPAVERMLQGIGPEDRDKQEQLAGHGRQINSGRSPVHLDEYIATVVDEQGNKIGDRALFVVANGAHLVRGPEPNPFWHGGDWLVYAPLITTPLSVYGRSYMEDFGAIAKTFVDLTNMLLDATFMSSMRAFVMVPSMLANPGQVAEGITANKIFLLDEGGGVADFAKALELGTLPPDAFSMWTALKKELSEAAGINEIGLGGFAPKGRTSATEVSEAMQNSSALIRSVAKTIETRYLDPTLDLVWKTGLQHVQRNDDMIRASAGSDEMFEMLISQRREFISRPITFQAQGISALIRKSQMLKALMGVLSVVSQSEPLMAEFFKAVSPEKFIGKLFELSDIDLNSMQLTERERLIREATAPLQAAQQQAQGAPQAAEPGAAEVQDAVKAAGIG